MPGTDSVTVWVAAHTGGNNGSEGEGGKQFFHDELL
ncbi:Uncharacterised protein [Klebsiella pneumoniae]|uniref:Uncharacterized protein n=1 Tax=Klebsiella pneumoniae TaxID=573 RepID=A0A509A740_KLEPN|nr:Uncharacterised protein [Klebsiella pneumoniae]